MPQASAKSNIVQPDKLNEPIFTPRFIAGFAVNFILYMQYYALMVAMAGYSAMQFAAGATEGGFTASVFILGALCLRFAVSGVSMLSPLSGCSGRVKPLPWSRLFHLARVCLWRA